MTKYLLKRIGLGILSVVVVVAIVMILIFTFTKRDKIFSGDGIYTKKQNNDREVYMYSQWEKYGYLDYIQYTDYLNALAKAGEIDEETRAAASKIARKESGDPEIVAKYGKVNGRVAFEAMRAGDEAAKEVIDMYLKYLESGLASMINIFQPEVLSIGGGISGEGDPLVEMILPSIRDQQYGIGFTELTKVCIAELGNDAGIIGAAFLGI